MLQSGIYALKWPSGKFYIGKSDNIARRWKEHANAFVKGKHAKAMQACFINEGEPSYEVLEYIHSDHIDLYEGMYIASNINNPQCLNATKGKAVTQEDTQELIKYKDLLKLSTVEHLKYMSECLISLDSTEDELIAIREEGIVMPNEIKAIEKENERLKSRINRLMKRSLLDRILNRECV
jgi:hypothetical protein